MVGVSEIHQHRVLLVVGRFPQDKVDVAAVHHILSEAANALVGQLFSGVGV